ncbi:molecular chaperone TorD family protein [Paucibacter sediminis]|uniref:Molecular chaperone TorD family protein n=1 Tax=Paucibacter sediminis TaxID=3019553 RepID=A0AA95ND17_9BURK|nr:molecular chaperone TorD family protein [Paucibacter sp. S2-9]WIT11980.1 molecular chaperone TorD family protein [Paucibacter sp. S2-9]
MSEHAEKQALAREDLCRFISACYYEPMPAFAEERLFESMLNAAQCLDPELAASACRLGEAFAACELQDLLVDYARLFLGPMQALAPPYGSRWACDASQAAEARTAALMALYDEGGFDIDEACRELPDHVAIQMEFLYLLNYAQNQARREHDLDGLAAAQALQRRFLAEQLGGWVGPFTAAIGSKAETAFYRELGAFTAGFARTLV